MALARPSSPAGSKHDSPSVLRERALAQALDDLINEVAEAAERHAHIQEAIGRLEDRIAALKLWDAQDEDGRAKQAEALRKEDEVRGLKAQAEHEVLGILQHILDIEENMEVVVDDGDECRHGQRVMLSRRFAAYERYHAYAGWVGVLQSRVVPGVWRVHFPAMHLEKMLELPIATGEGPHDRSSFALIYAVPRFRRWAKEAMQTARRMLAKASDLADEVSRKSHNVDRKEGKTALQECRAEMKRLSDLANIEEARSWTPFTNGVSWLASVLPAGVWADAHVSETDRWCHAGRQVVLTPAAAGESEREREGVGDVAFPPRAAHDVAHMLATHRCRQMRTLAQTCTPPPLKRKEGRLDTPHPTQRERDTLHPTDKLSVACTLTGAHTLTHAYRARALTALTHLSACKNMVGLLVKAIKPGVWGVKFGSLGIRHCRTGKQDLEEKIAFDLYYLQSAHSLAAESVAAAKPAWARGFTQAHGFPAESTHFDDVLCKDAHGHNFTLGDALIANPTTFGVSGWFSLDTEDLVLESDEACRTGTYVMLSYAAEQAHEEWIGMVGVLCKRTRIGQWLVRFPRGSLDRLVSHGILNTGLLNKFDLVYAENRMHRILVESKRNLAIQRKQRIHDMKLSRGQGSDKSKTEAKPVADAVGLGSSDAVLNVLNQLVVLMFRVASPDWRQQEQALIQLGSIVAPWMMLDYSKGVAHVAALAPKGLWDQRLVKEEFQGSALWEECVQPAISHLDVLPVLIGLIVGVPASASSSPKAQRRGGGGGGKGGSDSASGGVRSCVRVIAARVLGATLMETDACYNDAMRTLLGEGIAGTGIADSDDSVRKASSAALVLSVIQGDVTMVKRLVSIFLQPNVTPAGPAATLATLRRKVQLEAEVLLRFIANGNDPDLVASLVHSVCMRVCACVHVHARARADNGYACARLLPNPGRRGSYRAHPQLSGYADAAPARRAQGLDHSRRSHNC